MGSITGDPLMLSGFIKKKDLPELCLEWDSPTLTRRFRRQKRVDLPHHVWRLLAKCLSTISEHSSRHCEEHFDKQIGFAIADIP